MSFEIEGKLHKKFDTSQVTDTFKKREFVLELGGPYTQYVSFQLIQDKCGMLDEHEAGKDIKVFFDLRGREWTSPKGEVKYFNTLNCWKLEAVAPVQTDASGSDFPAAGDEPPAFDNADNDDLPF